MNSTGTLPEALPPILRESVPVATIMAIIALATLNFQIKKRASNQRENAGNFDKKQDYARSEALSKTAMVCTILLLIAYIASVAGLFTGIANIILVGLGFIWVVSTIISIFLL